MLRTHNATVGSLRRNSKAVPESLDARAYSSPSKRAQKLIESRGIPQAWLQQQKAQSEYDENFKAFVTSQAAVSEPRDEQANVPPQSGFRALHSVLSSIIGRDEEGDESLPDSLRPRSIAPRNTELKPSPRLPFYRRRIEGMIAPQDGAVLQDLKPLKQGPRIARLNHGLGRVLTNPGPHWLQEPRSRFFNFPLWLKRIPSVDDFAFERVSGFVTSSRDDDLWQLARRERCSFAGSTSSLSGMLSQIYLLLSNEKPVDIETLSAPFQRAARTFTPGQRMPVSVTLNYRDGVYATDSDVGHLGKTETILSQLGILMENYLTMTLKDFQTLLKKSPVPLPEDHALPKETYRYSKFGKFVMRAQLDCQHPSLPGKGIFDIKTRAAVPIRYDLENYKDNLGYKIRTMQGLWQSFEKEYYDLIRSAFLKYSFQVRIGNMDGVFVAYHNTEEVFGFQYIPVEEMDKRLFGHTAGSRVFAKCLGLLDAIFSEIVIYFPEQSVNCTWETRESGQVMHVWIEPKEWPTKVKPIVQLDVKVDHYLDKEKVTAHEAVGSVDGPWSVTYSITKSSLSQELIRKRRRGAHDRQLLIYKFGLHPSEKVERGQDIDLRHFDVPGALTASTHTPSPDPVAENQWGVTETMAITTFRRRKLQRNLFLKGVQAWGDKPKSQHAASGSGDSGRVIDATNGTPSDLLPFFELSAEKADGDVLTSAADDEGGELDEDPEDYADFTEYPYEPSDSLSSSEDPVPEQPGEEPGEEPGDEPGDIPDSASPDAHVADEDASTAGVKTKP